MKNKLHDFASYHSQLVAVLTSVAAVLLIDLAMLGVFKQIPNRIVSTWAPLYGEFLYSFKIEMIILVDLILFIILFFIVHSLIKRMGFNDYEE